MAPPIHHGPLIASKVESPVASQLHRELQSPMSRLTVKESPLVFHALNDQQKSNISRAGLRLDDNQTQILSSSTKPASLDSKSTTSGTTFALDEKESLQPDDSASVKAAEDEDYGSGPASGAQNSRVGSEAGSRAFRDQFYEITESIGSGSHRMHPVARKIIAGIEEEGPQMTRSPLISALPAPVNLPRPQTIAPSGPLIDYKYQEPDEKLLEALESPKDRLFLLRLEQEVITFVRDSHPPPLSALTPKAPVPTDAQSSSQPTMKIMRRACVGRNGQITESGANTADGSMAPSKAGSENGDDSQRGTGVASPTDSNLAKDKSAMTREEREAKYKETRERIFGPESEIVDSNEALNEVSRTSSRNEKKKKKHKNNDDDFEARSQFNAYYPSLQYPVTTYDQTAASPAYYSPYTTQQGSILGQAGAVGAAMLQQGYQQGYNPMSAPQGFPAMTSQIPMLNGYEVQTANANAGTFNQQLSSQYYPSMQQGVGMGQSSPVMSSPAISNHAQFSRAQSQLSDQQWSQNSYSYPYPQQRDLQPFFPSPVQSPNLMAGVASVPYQYGQLPLQPGMQGARAQHPLPGSYKSQAFNPQTRPFVPNGGSVSPQTAQHGNTSNPSTQNHNGNQYSPYTQQSSPYHQGPLMSVSGSYTFSQEPKAYGTRKISTQLNATHSPVQSSLSKWGTPSHLPPKPPPPEVPSMPEVQHSLPMNNQFNVNVQPLNGGQQMPNFQNGVYSMPGVDPQAM
ncbi:MAG: hypothetical protein ASARMPRED_002126 [Alectoria sarmentosa]|nr:MAG: hypothetical protein ASARMPRED_002126 [Alectoria sarmentosa]